MLTLLNISCISNLTMQTAEVLPKGVSSTGGAVVISPDGRGVISQYTGRPDIYEQEYKKNNNSESENPYIQPPWFIVRYGLGDGFDIGSNISLYAVEGYFKYQFFNSGDFFLATGINSYYGYRPNIIDGNEPGIHSFDMIFPLYVSYNILPKYAVYGSGKYTLRNTYSKIEEDYYNDNSPRHLMSVTLGNKIMNSNNYSIMFELCVIKDLGINFYSTQVNVGITDEY